MAFIRTISPSQATGLLKQIYDGVLQRAGRVFHVLRLMSIRPPVLQASLGLYAVLMQGPSKLSRREREMIATVVSRENNCYY